MVEFAKNHSGGAPDKKIVVLVAGGGKPLSGGALKMFGNCKIRI